MELAAIRLACGIALTLKLNQIMVESDSQLAITLSVSEFDPQWEVRALVLDIRHARNCLGLKDLLDWKEGQ